MDNGATQKSALGMDGNVTALIAYLVGIVALILIFIEKDNKFVRFHALQAFFWVLAMVVAMIGVLIIGAILGGVLSFASGTLGGIVWGLTALAYVGIILALLGGLLYGAIKSFGGNYVKLPFVGNIAEKMANK
jgi:uncharacterized membrane protein